ncbi:hypothetical protein NAP1_12723 [Erythrobacter sp. NAP1]|uniref:SDR family NAD(P)-dependent oxidoreductase n=1 Tax=Erythrobacter sp. NAP1 TaxID=237727 RepID=UPI00006877EB|nr:SDR family NAD(P)-dependent oxidoreductase [Erythrobacter sp. NAP1]EAQ28462.1 hypothetical protein NAP1_12723 [Erythrobacter sp. NAP1]
MSAAVVITGARSGLGAAVYRSLSEQQVHCIPIVRSPMRDGNEQQSIADLAEPQDWTSKLAPFLSHLAFERLWFFDIAAVLPLGGMLDDGAAGRMEEAMMVNVASPFAIADVLAPIARAKSASLDVVHISSGAASRPIPGWGAYCVSKAAAALGWQVLADENKDVAVHIFQPGVIATGMQTSLREADDPAAAPEAVLQTPEEVARNLLSQTGFAP